jgi:hypothetical protein
MTGPDPQLLDAVWQQGRVMPDADPEHWRQDSCGAWMRREHFGREDSDFGWKLEKISPGEAATPENLRPFNVRNHYDIANHRPHCLATADRMKIPSEELAKPPRNRSL